MNIEWTLKHFQDLSPFEVYEYLRLRSEVFVVEQACVYLDADNYDQQCYHLAGRLDNVVKAYTRIVPPGVIYDYASIGRVVTSPSVRRHGAGRLLMQQSIDSVYKLFGQQSIKIGAQLYLKKFYESFGFQKISDVYLEDGIEHIYMLKETS